MDWLDSAGAAKLRPGERLAGWNQQRPFLELLVPEIHQVDRVDPDALKVEDPLLKSRSRGDIRRREAVVRYPEPSTTHEADRPATKKGG